VLPAAKNRELSSCLNPSDCRATHRLETVWISLSPDSGLSYRGRMRMVVRSAGAVVALCVALSAAGCTQPPTAPSPSPTPSATPLFESDAAALAAAEEAYAAYLAVTDQVFAEGGTGLERLDTVAAGALLEADRTGLLEAAAAGYRSTGTTTFSATSLQRFGTDSEGMAELVVYLCEDVSDVDVLDGSGNSVVSVDRPDQVRYQVSFSSSRDKTLVVSNKEVWGDGGC
jgi:hypothetical protein